MATDPSGFYSAHQAIEACLRRHGLSQKEAAEKLGISQGYLCDVLKGRRRVTPELASLVADRIEIESKSEFLADVHYLGALQDGWKISRAALRSLAQQDTGGAK